MHSYRYLRLKFSASGSFTLARANLYNTGLKAYFKLVKDILSFQPSVNTSIHIFHYTVRPVLLYGSEIWEHSSLVAPDLEIMYHVLRFIRTLIQINLIQSFVNLSLGLKKGSNFGVYAKMGRRPFYLDIVKSILHFGMGLKICLLTFYYNYNALKCSKICGFEVMLLVQ